jgi:hypothetical protein
MTVKQLLAKARECETCGRAHKPWRSKATPNLAPQWSARDGHPYRPRVPRGAVEQIERLAVST